MAIAERIPGARLVLILGCGHLLTTEAEQPVAEAVLSHLRAGSPAATVSA